MTKSDLKRAAIVSLKIANQGKLDKLRRLREIGKAITTDYINLLWNVPNLPTRPDSKHYGLIGDNRGMSARFCQTMCEKAFGLIHANRTRIKNVKFAQEWVIKNAFRAFCNPTDNNTVKHIDKLGKINRTIRKLEEAKPVLHNFSLDLTAKCCSITVDSSKSIKNWITVKSLLPKQKGLMMKNLPKDDIRRDLHIPFTRTKIFNKWMKAAEKVPTAFQFVELFEENSAKKKDVMKLVFSVKKPLLKKKGTIEGCDIGITTVWTLSNEKEAVPSNSKDQTLYSILVKMTKKKNATVNFRQSRTHRTNFCNWNLNKLDLTGIKELHIENIRGMKKGAGVRKHWSYFEILNKIKRRCEEEGIRIVEVNPRFTSQRCYECGWVHKPNRNNKNFKCTKCGHSTDADLNAAKNIRLLDDKTSFGKGDSLVGFYSKLLQ